eukprot:CAMPEP_0181212720 /NCGR_PEP_ID=MMETSP1096-20121128/24508_1 /TAXON_ID=156174 ORGANISM="Chrysochromulina ericina, Strain CCMP281" /NCGR_SAMPLE_ID=MMETSP1096 /ASSEMBLY_ACC=CAM_ASM_000453 /LENGTH=251 /DNA_ID=CAMNT_0023304283 /DNA_START=31 /DNA_END=786 /DNA_ORIENTATION=-
MAVLLLTINAVNVVPPAAMPRRSVLAATAASLAGLHSHSIARAFDPDLAGDLTNAGAQCASQSCIDKSLEKMRVALDPAGVRRNQKGERREHMPVVTLDVVYGLRKEASIPVYEVVAVADHPMDADDRIELMWLKEEATGKIVAARAFRGTPRPPLLGGGIVPDRSPPTLRAVLKEPFTPRGAVIVPYVFCKRDGLWEGEPFKLCDADDTTCDARGKFRPSRKIDDSRRFDGPAVGEEVLRQFRVDREQRS